MHVALTLALLAVSLSCSALVPAVAQTPVPPGETGSNPAKPGDRTETPSIALVNRSEENVVTQASDAFGTSVGAEGIGLYSGSNVRGFSAFAAQNVRIERLYLGRQARAKSVPIASDGSL